MQFYTNIAQYRGSLLVTGVNEYGKRFKQKIKYKPYIFLPSKNKNSIYHTLSGKPVEKLDFDSLNDARDFLKKYEDIENFEFYGLTDFKYLYLYDNFPGEIEFDSEKIKRFNIDIEVESESGFPDPTKAEYPITAITIKSKNKIVVFAYGGDFTTNDEQIHFIKCKNEKDLLTKFLRYWVESGYPDVITGWNIETFDIPYIINRMLQILGAEATRTLSPWKLIEEKEIIIMGKENQTYLPMGISVLDYLQLYKKFSFKNHESYKLDYIANEELGVKKIEYEGSLSELYRTDFQKYIEYNIRDVMLVEWLEDKLKLLEQVYILAYDAKVNYSDTMVTVKPWDIIIHNFLMDRNIVIPKKPDVSSTGQQFAGAYVMQPKVGMHEWVVSFDLTSLYPHLIMQYNISPETYVGKFGDYVSFENLINERFDNSFLKKHNYSMTANLNMYDNSIHGFLPQIMEEKFKQRSKYKNLMLEAKSQYEKTKDKTSDKLVARYNNMQMAIKIQLNSAYGALGNAWFRWFDINHAEAITSSGQFTLHWITRELNDWLNEHFNTTDEEYVIYGDTDSVYVTLKRLVDDKKDMSTEEKIDFIQEFCDNDAQNFINKSYEKLADYMNAYAQRMYMKREDIASKGIWRAKKAYILNVYKSESVTYSEPKIKVVGMEAVKSSTPNLCRKGIKECLKLILNSDERSVQNYIKTFKDQYKDHAFEEIASPRGCNNIEKYYDPINLFKDKTPIHVRGSIVYNTAIKENKLQNKYPLIYSGDKVKFAYLTLPNPLKQDVISIPDKLPKELEIDKYIDYETQFNKTFLKPIETILDVVGWESKKRARLE